MTERRITARDRDRCRQLSRDLGGIPIRNFYFDGTQSDLDRDLGVYLELARNYQRRKKWQRSYPESWT